MTALHYPAGVPSKYLSIQGVATFLRHVGKTTLPEQPPDLSRGEALICLHHTGGNARNFDAFCEIIGEKHSPVSFDLPGHDRSGSSESLGTVEAMAAFVAAGADVLAPGRPLVMVGHGMGGAVAIQFALDHPERTRALVLCASGGAYPCDDTLVERTRRVSEGKTRREFDAKAFAQNTSPEVLKHGFIDTLKTDPRIVFRNLSAWQQWKGMKRLSELRVESLVCVGAEERDTIVEKVDALVSSLDSAQKHLIPDCGHMIPHEAPGALAEAVGAFLENLG